MSTKTFAKKPADERKDVYGIITDRILARMEQGEIPWEKGWLATPSGRPRNYVSGKPYRGINLVLLPNCYSSPYWLTYRQATELGGTVRKGEKSSIIVFYKPITREVRDEERKEVRQVIVGLVIRYYNVFNLDQTEGVPVKEVPEGGEVQMIDDAEAFFGALNQDVRQGDPAYYPDFDFITMPGIHDFVDSRLYYATRAHETIHWSGAEKRTGRAAVKKAGERGVGFGSEEYSQEELCAEIGAAFLADLMGISDRTEDRSVAYLQNWIKVLKNDTRMVVRAAGQAQTAVDWLMEKAYGKA